MSFTLSYSRNHSKHDVEVLTLLTFIENFYKRPFAPPTLYFDLLDYSLKLLMGFRLSNRQVEWGRTTIAVTFKKPHDKL